MLNRDQFREAMVNARYTAALVARLPLAEMRAAIEHAEAFSVEITPQLRADRALIETLLAAQTAIGAPELPKHPHSVEQADGSGDASRILFATGAP